MKSLPVVNWMIKLCLGALLLAGAAGYYVWNNTDRLAHAELIKQFDQLAPGLKLEVERTEVQGTSAVVLHDVVIHNREKSRPIFRAEQVRIDVHSDQLLNHQRLVLEQVTITKPDVLLIRKENGRWNWQDFEFHPPAQRGTLPAVIIQDAQVQLTLHHAAGLPSARLPLACPILQAIPESADSYDFEGTINLPGAGDLQLAGLADFASKTWHLGGSLKEVTADHRLMDLATSTNPDLKSRLADLDRVLATRLPSVRPQTVEASGTALQLGNDHRIAPQFMGTLDIDFQAGSNPQSSIPDFKLLVKVKDGRLGSAALPIGLSNVQARFYKDNQNLQLEVTHSELASGILTGKLLIPSGDPSAANGSFQVEQFPIDARLRPLLPEKAQRMFDAYEPEGAISFQGDVARTPEGTWQPRNLQATLHDTEVSYEKFQYPTTITGRLVQRQQSPEIAAREGATVTLESLVLDVELAGRFDQHPFVVNGFWKNPGEKGELQLQLDISDFPLDGRFRSALLPAQQKVVNTMNLTGKATGSVMFYRPPGLNQITHPFAKAKVTDATMKLEKFPYQISSLSGDLTFHGPSKKWTFENLQGQHGEARLSASGTYVGLPAPGVLEMRLRAEQAALDADLYHALSAQQRTIWKLLDPEGFCDVTADIHWVSAPGQAAVVRFPAQTPVRIYNTRIKPVPFPYELKVQEALVSFDPNDATRAGVQRCVIHSFKAMHEGSPIHAKGWFEAKPNQEWQMHFSELHASSLKPDNALRAALPASWSDALARMYNQGTISIVDSELDFRGDIQGAKNPTACWNMTMNLNDCTINAGLDISEIQGKVTAQGVWDGFHLQNTGRIRLDTAAVLEMPITNIEGPYSVNDVELVLGARRLFEKDQNIASVPLEDRINARAYGGRLLLDAVVDLSPEGRYQFFTQLADAKLESYAALHIPEQPNLRGVVTAWMSLNGFGDDATNVQGNGELRISPAALYELPVMVKLLGTIAQMNPNVRNRTAFTYALVKFAVGERKFNMNRIDLVGEEISFRGQGSVGFEGGVNLDFYSQPPRRRALSLPIINELFTRWTKIEVRGTTKYPQENVKALGQLDENLRTFLQPFNPTPDGPIPTLQIPQFMPFQPLMPRRRYFEGQNQFGRGPLRSPSGSRF